MRRATVKKIESGIVLVLLFATTFSWIFAVSRLFSEQKLNDVSEYFDNFRVLLSDEINITSAGNWDMGQTIREGDMVMWVRPDQGKVGTGDLVLCRDEDNSVIARRVISTDNGCFQVRGDSLGSETYSVSFTDIVGQIIGVIYER
ncbi:MAG: S24/S26 family peptidase [Candidatus Hadarchaeales archaeon]